MSKRRKEHPVRKHRSLVDRAWPWLFGAVVVLGLAVVVYAIRSQPNFPRPGAHWHAPFSIEICGQRLAPLPYSPGNIHTHGDDVIHIHPETVEEGRRATLATFFQSVRMEVTAHSITLPDGRTYRNGDTCPDGREGRVRILVNGLELANPLEYFPQDRDRIRIVFE
jgi:hypothetical protein